MTNEGLQPNQVVVYGTLMRGLVNHRYLEVAQFLGTDSLDTIVLYDLELFPAARLGASQGIEVEVYRIDSETLQALDALEGLKSDPIESGLYVRRVCETVYGLAWIYLYNRSVQGAKPLVAGRWSPLVR